MIRVDENGTLTPRPDSIDSLPVIARKSFLSAQSLARTSCKAGRTPGLGLEPATS